MSLNTQNFTTGNVLPKLVRFAIPLLLANLMQSFYSIVDLLIVGRFVGAIGIAAISNASMISFIISSFSIGITMGGTVLTAQYRGANDKERQTEVINTLLALSLISSAVITALSLLIYRPLFFSLHVPAEAMGDACGYMKIICVGTVFTFGYNAVASIQKGYGDSKSPFYFVSAAALANILFDLILVGPAKLGTQGAAYATVISQAIAFLFSMLYLKRKSDALNIPIRFIHITPAILKRLLVIGLPTAVQMIAVNLSYLLVTGMLNVFGVSAAAASGIGLKINTFAGMPCWAIGQAVTAMVGQNMGVKNYERIRNITRIGLTVNLITTLFVIIFVQIFAVQLIELFQTESAEIIRTGVLYLRICCSVNSLFYAIMYTFDSFAIGLGKANIAMVNSFLDAAIVRIPVSWALAFTLQYGYVGIYAGQALSPIIPAIVGFLYFKRNRWAGE